MNIFPENIDFTSQEGIGQFISTLIVIALDIVGVVCIIFIVWGAILLITAGGNEEKMAKGKSTLTWAILGFILVLGAEYIMKQFKDIIVK